MNKISLSQETSALLVLDILKRELECLEKYSFPNVAQHDLKQQEKDLKAFKRVITFYQDGWP